MKVFVSQLMRGLTDEQILGERERGLAFLAEQFPNESIEVQDTFLSGGDKIPLKSLGILIAEGLAECDLVLFIGEWKKYRGCVIEHEVAVQYNIRRLYFDPSKQEALTFRERLEYLKENHREQFLEKIKEVEGRISKRKSCGCVCNVVERRGMVCHRFKRYVLKRAVLELWASVHASEVDTTEEAEAEEIYEQAEQEVGAISEGVPTEGLEEEESQESV